MNKLVDALKAGPADVVLTLDQIAELASWLAANLISLRQVQREKLQGKESQTWRDYKKLQDILKRNRRLQREKERSRTSEDTDQFFNGLAINNSSSQAPAPSDTPPKPPKPKESRKGSKKSRCLSIYIEEAIKGKEPSIPEIAHRVKCSESTAYKAIQEFADKRKAIGLEKRLIGNS
jgi:hypothetical protein